MPLDEGPLGPGAQGAQVDVLPLLAGERARRFKRTAIQVR